MSILTKEADPLFVQPRAERPAYATGMLLDAQDFSDEQTYHRSRLARAMAFLAGGGTLAGLEVEHVPGSATQVEEIRVKPGLAVDRLGRLVELPRDACIRLPNWFALIEASDGGDTLRTAAYENVARFVSPRMSDSAAVLPASALIADVFIRFVGCPVGLTPSFAQGPFDALNAVSTSRIRDAYELKLIPRSGLDDAYDGLPIPPADAVLSNPASTAAERRDAAQDAVLDAYGGAEHAGGSGGLQPAPEHPADLDYSAVFLGRVFIPVDDITSPARTADVPLVDNWGRRFLPSSPLLAQWVGL
ncbi:hypothetical protein VVD49_06410 [Uliginosibacterium sp. H3]|uniref:Uncharacterized protein n=1 Tax=Uliginosibacterium silvisoli TaxID=3114758 RepID=A0ABU6K2P8_9RHOO|nr:hypothetical protein [Uliginosibacterium sp. H3]